ncbi:MAG: hypothetical protein U5L96_15390 [Owenweeksia sp.]|nr:hypothetical protein [Owenweeksia sp.]
MRWRSTKNGWSARPIPIVYLANVSPGYSENIPESPQQSPGNGVDGELANKLAPYFEVQGLPNQVLGVYDPRTDYPAYDIDGTEDCTLKETDLLYGDQTVWWVYNDKGNTHTGSQAACIRL